MLEFGVGAAARGVARQGHVEEQPAVEGSIGQPVVDPGLAGVVEAGQPFPVVAGGVAPGEVQVVGFRGQRALGVVAEDRVGVALATFEGVGAGAHGELVAGIEPVVAAQAEGLADARVVDAAEAVVAGAGGRDAHPQAVVAVAPAGLEVGDAVVAQVGLGSAALVLARVAGDDVDHPEKGVGPEGVGVGAADDLDALDLVDGEGERRPVDPAEGARRIHRAAVDENLHLGGEVAAQPVVGDPLGVAALLADLHARHQAQQARHVAVAGGADEIPVEDRDGPRRLVEDLGQARGRQHRRQLFEEGRLTGGGRHLIGANGGSCRQGACKEDEQGPGDRGHRRRAGFLFFVGQSLVPWKYPHHSCANYSHAAPSAAA